MCHREIETGFFQSVGPEFFHLCLWSETYTAPMKLTASKSLVVWKRRSFVIQPRLHAPSHKVANLPLCGLDILPPAFEGKWTDHLELPSDAPLCTLCVPLLCPRTQKNQSFFNLEMIFDILRRALELPKACKAIVEKRPFQEYLRCIQMSLKTKPQWRRDAFALLLPN